MTAKCLFKGEIEFLVIAIKLSKIMTSSPKYNNRTMFL